MVADTEIKVFSMKKLSESVLNSWMYPWWTSMDACGGGKHMTIKKKPAGLSVAKGTSMLKNAELSGSDVVKYQKAINEKCFGNPNLVLTLCPGERFFNVSYLCPGVRFFNVMF